MSTISVKLLIFFLQVLLINSQVYIRPPSTIKLFNSLSLKFNKLSITCSSENSDEMKSYEQNVELSSQNILDLKLIDLHGCKDESFIRGKLVNEEIDISVDVLIINYDYIKTEQVYFKEHSLINDNDSAVKLNMLYNNKTMKHNNALKLYVKTTGWYKLGMRTKTNVELTIETIDDTTFEVFEDKVKVEKLTDFSMSVTGTMFIKIELADKNEIEKFLDTEIKFTKEKLKE
eukprot:GAHX01001896.1.p1 GENE.GAHX01001896.1~~GAHX01001896.1.p1  ORF type:complete len:231 (+),score=57.12 GAHX01001896.1:270-962(+)